MTDTKYTTVEGHPIHADCVYRTREGEMATILCLLPNEFDGEEVIGYVWYNKDKISRRWYSNGYIPGYGEDRINPDDLMRPWIASLDKPEASPTFDEYTKATNAESATVEAVDDEGWIKHTTGKQPVDDDVEVIVEFDGETTQDGFYAENWNWDLSYGEQDVGVITAYKIVEEKKPEKQTLPDYFEAAVTRREDMRKYFETSQSHFFLQTLGEYLEREDS